MIVYVGKSYTATITAKRLVPVRCEKCRTEYSYELTRSGNGRASAPYYLGQEAAQRRAEVAANKMAEKLLMRDAEMVPCPKCHWVNQHLIEAYRRSRYSWIFTTGCVVGGLVLLVVALVGLAMYLHNELSFYWRGLVGWGLPAAALIVATWWLRGYLRGRIDPNVTYPREPALPRGRRRRWSSRAILGRAMMCSCLSASQR